jgi:hypothetical protein
MGLGRWQKEGKFGVGLDVAEVGVVVRRAS